MAFSDQFGQGYTAKQEEQQRYYNEQTRRMMQEQMRQRPDMYLGQQCQPAPPIPSTPKSEAKRSILLLLPKKGK